MNGDPGPEEGFTAGFSAGYKQGYELGLQDSRAALENLAQAYDDEIASAAQPRVDEALPAQEPEAEVADEVILVAPETVTQPEPASDPQKVANRERANRIGRSGVYWSSLAKTEPPKEVPQPVMLVQDDGAGWWFFLPDSWPEPEWRADIRWFPKEGAEFVEDMVIPMRVPTRIGLTPDGDQVIEWGPDGDDAA